MPSAQQKLTSDGARRFFDYWDAIRGDDLVPDRKSFDPIAIRELMPAVTILEIWSPERIVPRLAGTGVCDGMGLDPTGRNWLDLQRPELREGYARRVTTQANHPCGRRSILRTRNVRGAVTRAEVIALPMTHALSGHKMLVSFFATLAILGYEDGGYQVLDFEETHWIDIGAGVPDWT